MDYDSFHDFWNKRTDMDKFRPRDTDYYQETTALPPLSPTFRPTTEHSQFPENATANATISTFSNGLELSKTVKTHSTHKYKNCSFSIFHVQSMGLFKMFITWPLQAIAYLCYRNWPWILKVKGNQYIPNIGELDHLFQG